MHDFDPTDKENNAMWVPVFTDHSANITDHAYIAKWGRVTEHEAQAVYADGLSEGWIVKIVPVQSSQNNPQIL